MAEAIETRFATIRTLARVAYAAEVEVVYSAPHKGIIDGRATRTDFAQAAIGFGFVAEGVEAEGCGTVVISGLAFPFEVKLEL